MGRSSFMQYISRGAITDAVVAFRWVMLLGQAMAIATGALALAERGNLLLLLAILLLGHIPTLILALRPRLVSLNILRLEALFAYDLVHNALIVWLAGGIFNPFLLLMIVPVTSAAIICSLNATMRLMALATILVVALGLHAFFYLGAEMRTEALVTYIAMTAVAFILAISFASLIAFRLTRESRRLENAAGMLRSMLERERGVAALGAHAAATAHELGSPLSTIAVIAGELAKDTRLPKEVLNDLQDLRDETRRCRDILGDLARRGELPGPESQEQIPLHVTIDRAVHRVGERDRNKLDIHYYDQDREVDPQREHAPFLRDIPGVTLAFKAFVENALRFANKRVNIDCHWDDEKVTIAIRDDGPGFAKDIIDRLGEPFVKDQASMGFGLGIFTAHALLERAGAKINYANRPGGAQVRITWGRDAMTQHPVSFVPDA
tara:strand:+ start:1327 stop:2637 length:1311 start_codon:yes stop_codon:yes gene_type:complete